MRVSIAHTRGVGRTGEEPLFCLLADVQIHQRTHNQKGLEDALRGILAAGGNIKKKKNKKKKKKKKKKKNKKKKKKTKKKKKH